MERRDSLPAWTIRPLERISEYHDCEEIQRRAWNFAGDLDIVPLTQMVAAHRVGGVVLGAFAEDGTMMGFCYSFLGRRTSGELLQHSHMLAVDARFRSAGLGAALKWAQRDAVLAQGIEWIAWTYDPLESLNAYLNFSKLGVVARNYWEDLYGQTSSGLHRGMPTDRLLAEWPLRAARVKRLAAGAHVAYDPARLPGLPALLHATIDAAGLPAPGLISGADDAREVTIEIPEHIQEIKAADPDLARCWRMATRAAFTQSFAAGYHVAECLRHDGHTYYLLRSGEPELAYHGLVAGRGGKERACESKPST